MISERRVRHAFRASAVAYAAVLLLTVTRMPDRVPLHFGADGTVDRWGSRLEAILALGGVGILMAVVFEGRAVLTRRVSLGLINVPDKDWWAATPEREATMRSRLAADLYVLGVMTYALLALSIVAMATAGDGQTRLPSWMYIGLGVHLAGMVGWVAWMFLRRYRPIDGM